MEVIMTEVVRFGVSFEKQLLRRFDLFIKNKKYTNRSEAIRDIIREKFVEEEWQKNKQVAGAIVLVYDHHKRDLVNNITDIQHDYGNIIISTQHIHLDHHNCLEVIVVKGMPIQVKDLFQKLRSEKGVKHGALNMTTTGKDLE